MHMKRVEFRKGYVTTFAAIAGRTTHDLEKALGYLPGALRPGYSVYELSDPVLDREFEWKGYTKWSDGWQRDDDCGEYAQCFDELRADFGRADGYDEKITDAELRVFLQEHLRCLNVREGMDRIVKVLPKVDPRLTAAKAKPNDQTDQRNSNPDPYPDSPYKNVPQWKLTVTKRFTLLFDRK